MSADTGVRDSALVVSEGFVGSVQIADLQITQKAEGSSAPTGGDTMMGDAPGVASLDPDSRLSIFLAHFDLLKFNSLPASDFHFFGFSYSSFLHFFVLVEGLPLLEGLLKSHGDFTSGFRGGAFLGNILMELLCAVLISLRDSSINSLSEEKLLEWKGGGTGPFGVQVQPILLAGTFTSTGPCAIPEAGFQEYR